MSNVKEEFMRITSVIIVAGILALTAGDADAKQQAAAKTGMKATVDKIATALEQTAVEQFQSGRDSLGAATCIKVYDLDNSAYKEFLLKAGNGFANCGAASKAQKAYETYLEKFGADQRALVGLASIVYGAKNYAKAAELLKQAPLAVASQERLCMMLAESDFAIGQFDETVSILTQSKHSATRRGLELCAPAYEKMGEFQKSLACWEKLVTISQDKKRLEYGFRIARIYEQLNQNDKAIRCYEQMLSEYPDDVRCTERLAALCLQTRSFRQAQQLLQKAVTLPNATPVLKKMLGQSLAAQGNRIPAINWYKQYLEAVPTDSAAWCELGAAYYEQEHYAEAIEVLAKSVALQPRNEECLVTLGTCYVKTGDLISASGPLEIARSINKYDIRTLSLLAACYRTQNDTKRLSSVLRDWTIADPKNATPRFELGDRYVWEQKYRDAIPLLESACALDSADAQIHLSLAKAYEKTGGEANRLAHLRKALACSPKNAEAQFEFGRLLLSRNQREAAMPYFAKAVVFEPGFALAQFEYGRLLLTLGQRDSAYEHLNAAVQLEPLNTGYLVQFAQAAYAAGNKQTALDIIKRALSRDSSNAEILQWAGLLYKETGSIDTAKQLLLRSVARGTACASCFKYLADIYLANGEYDLAVKFYNQSLALGSFSESAALGLGTSLLMTGDAARAQMIFEKAFAENQKSEEALYRLCSVYLRTGATGKAKTLLSTTGNQRKSGWIRLCEGEIAETENRTAEALISFSVAASFMPENPLTHAGLGRLNLAGKQFEKAIENFGNASARDPHNPEFLLGMGKAYEGMDQNQAAFDLYAEVARRVPRNAEVFYLLGEVLGKQKQHEQSVTALMRGITLSPKDGRMYFCLGNEYQALSRFKEALDAYKKAVRNKNDESRCSEAYKEMGNIYFNDIKDVSKARDCYAKYLKAGGKDEKIVQVVNSIKG
jgi:tetratricopeptide (TPR) repeat protein